MVGAVQATLLVPLISQLAHIYDVSLASSLWMVTVTLLASAVSAPVTSRLADIHGKRKVIVATLSATAVGSFLVAATDSFALGLTGRALQGLGSAVIPIGMSLLKDLVPANRVGPGIALMGAMMGIGSAVGVPVAGAVYAHLGWDSVFWIAGVAAAVCAGLGRFLLPAASGDELRARFDWVGAALITVVLTSLLLVIAQGDVWGWLSPEVVALAVVCPLAIAVWVPWQLRCAHPLVDVRLLRRHQVGLTNLATVVLSVAVMTNLYVAAQQLGTPATVPGGLGASPGAIGLMLSIPAAGFAALSPAVGRALVRFGGRQLMVLGSMAMAATYASRILLDESAVQVVVSTTLVSLATAMTLSAMPLLVMSAVPPSRTASAAGINTLCQTLGIAISSSGLAALARATSSTVNGSEYSTATTFHAAFAACIAVTTAAAILAWLMPRAEVVSGVACPVRG